VATARKLLTIILLLAAAGYGGERSLFDLVMPEAHVLAGVNVRRILTSPIGKDLSSQIRTASPEIERFQKTTGFDFTSDLDEIVLAAGGDPRGGEGLVLARGKFDPAAFAALAATKTETTIYRGVAIMSAQIPSRRGQRPAAFAFLNNSIAVLGEPRLVRDAIDRRERAAAIDPVLYAKARDLSDRYEVWAISAGSMTAPPAATAPDAGMKQAADLFKSIQQFSGGIRFSSKVEINAELLARTEKDANSLADGLRFVAGMLMAGQQNNTASAPPDVQMKVEGRALRISMTISEEEIRKASQARRNAVERAAVAPSVTPPPPADTGLTIQSSGKDMGTLKLPSAKKD
jgi:hypothetical protein